MWDWKNRVLEACHFRGGGGGNEKLQPPYNAKCNVENEFKKFKNTIFKFKLYHLITQSKPVFAAILFFGGDNIVVTIEERDLNHEYLKNTKKWQPIDLQGIWQYLQ